MLTLEPPFYEINHITVYRDHAVPTQFYYSAPPPTIARSNGRIMFDIMAYSVELKHSVLSGTTIPDELGAGFLTMGTMCALTDAQRSALLRELESRTGLNEAQISLYPIPYHKGTVSVLALDQYTTPGTAPADPGSAKPLDGRPTFVEKIVGSGKPALLGDLRSIFSLALSQAGVSFLQGLYEANAAPVGVVYELAFYGLRPAVEARITANLSRIYDHFGGGVAVQYAWFKADISAALDQLVETGAVKIELTSQAVGEEAQKSKDLALSLFRDRIIQELFRPTTPAPTSTVAGVAGAAAAATGGAGTTGGTGTTGTASAALVTLTLQYKRTEELKTITYDFRERAPEERTHAPQGFLAVMLSPTELKQRIHQIDLQNEFFELLQVLVTGPSKEEFDALNLRQIEATLTYGAPGDAVPPEGQTLVFRPDTTGDKTFAVKRRERKSLGYTYALTYEFARTGGADGDLFRYEMPARPATGRSLRINPYADFGVLDVEVEPGRLHADVRQVDVALAYQSADGRFNAGERFRLTPGTAPPPPEQRHWQVRTQDTAVRPYTAAYTFIFQDGTVYEAPPLPMSDPLLRVDSPFRQDRELLIKPNPASPQITQITVELEYTDTINKYRRQFLVDLTAPFSSVRKAWPILDPAQQKVRYRVTVHEPGMISEEEWQETDEPSIIVGSVAHRVGKVQVQLIGPALDTVGIDAVQLKIALALPGQPPDEPQSVLLQGTQTTATVELILPPGSTLSYRYQTTTFKSSGQTVESEWKDMTNATLIVSTRNL